MKTSDGFTLLEVLVALVIIGLGLTAVFGQLNQSLVAAVVLRDKTLAYWIAADRITELRVAGDFPDVGETDDEIEMAGQQWAYTLRFSDVGVPNFRRVDVDVALASDPDRQLATVAGFLAKPDGQSNAAQFGGWTSGTPENPGAQAFQ
ncbi:MAG: type II secretion system minor pseudopilin GspI [Gammaproteobacteria bacterium]|nr:type II secretion system minor pseudopilin GspI [Gammaproteobacteria bacterium]